MRKRPDDEDVGNTDEGGHSHMHQRDQVWTLMYCKASRIPSVASVFAMTEEGDVELGFTPAQQEWIHRLVESQWDTNTQDTSSAETSSTTTT